jgi:hypothetical protein
MAFEQTLSSLKQLLNASNPGSARDIRRVIGESKVPGLKTKTNFNLSDYAWYPWYNSLKSEDIYKRIKDLYVPKLEIYEFQPATDLAMYINLLARAIEMAKNIGSGSAGAGEILSKIAEKLDAKISAGLDGIVTAENEGKILQNFNDANQYYLRVSDGKYMKRFEVPSYHDQVWNANGGQGWKGMGAMERYMSFASAFMPGGLDVPAKPIFQASNVENPSVSSKFYMFNGHITAALSNLEFIYSLLPGGYWMQDSFYQRGSNLYTVSYENFYQYRLCAMEASVYMRGKIRKAPARVVQQFPSVTMLPDIWEVDIQFKSLLPNTLNQFFAPYFPEFKVNVGQSTEVFNFVGNLIEGAEQEANFVGPPPPAPG